MEDAALLLVQIWSQQQENLAIMSMPLENIPLEHLQYYTKVKLIALSQANSIEWTRNKSNILDLLTAKRSNIIELFSQIPKGYRSTSAPTQS